MKKIYFLFFLVFGLNGYAQNPDDIVYIPDANFKARLLQASITYQIARDINGNFFKLDANNDGEIQINEAQLVYELYINSAGINSLLGIEEFLNIRVLYCEYNYLTSLNVSELSSLKGLYCKGNILTNLNVSNCLSLEILNCFDNYLTSLNVSGLINLQNLNCEDNQINDLNLSGCINLKRLNIEGNALTSLQFSELINLEYLYMAYNDFVYLDLSQNPKLFWLDAENNNLHTVILKNGNLNWGAIFLNYNENIQYVCADTWVIDFIQNSLSFHNIVCNVNSYCSFTPGGTFYTVQGNTRFDSNNNGCGVDDFNTANVKFIVSSGTATGNFISNQTGSYSIPVQAGNHTITPVLENPNYFTVSPTSTTVSFPSATSPYIQDFCITANGIKNDLEITIIPIEVARPGFDATYKIIYKNKGNQVSNGSLNFTFEDTIMDLVSVIPVNTSSANNSLSWNFSNLNPFETREIDLVFNINSPMATPAVNGGDVLVYTATIVGATDETPNDNTFTLNQTVVNSYDPNDKTCLEGATITPSMVGQYVHYVIRFENTGTYPAQNIVVADVIDSTKFDISTLIPQRSSHDFYTRIKGNKVEFIFENINLPFDDANNDGYVAFKIKTKSNLVLGNTFTNKANIYFDYNFPIITNTASTTVTALNTNDFDFGNYFTVYPNPVKEVLNFEVNKEIGVKSISVYNTLGQIVMAITNVDNLKDIDVSNLTAGSYFVKIYTDKGSSSSKFIKQ